MPPNTAFSEIEAPPAADDTTRSTGDKIRDKAANIGRRVADAVDSRREGIAEGLDGAARRATQASGVADRTADKLESMARYVRDNDTRAFMSQLESIVRGHPGKTLVAVAAIGYLTGRALRRS